MVGNPCAVSPASAPGRHDQQVPRFPAAALPGRKLFFEPRLSGAIQAGSPAEGQLGAIGETGKIACRDCHMPESKWLFDIRSNNGGPLPNATALGSLWMTRNASSIVNTVFYVHAGSGAHWCENDGYSGSEWFDARSEPEVPPVQNGSRLQLAHVIFEHCRAAHANAFPDWPLTPALADYSRFPATGSPGTGDHQSHPGQLRKGHGGVPAQTGKPQCALRSLRGGQ